MAVTPANTSEFLTLLGKSGIVTESMIAALGDLPSGAWRRLTPQEVAALQNIREQAEPRKPFRKYSA